MAQNYSREVAGKEKAVLAREVVQRRRKEWLLKLPDDHPELQAHLSSHGLKVRAPQELTLTSLNRTRTNSGRPQRKRGPRSCGRRKSSGCWRQIGRPWRKRAKQRRGKRRVVLVPTLYSLPDIEQKHLHHALIRLDQSLPPPRFQSEGAQEPRGGHGRDGVGKVRGI